MSGWLGVVPSWLVAAGAFAVLVAIKFVLVQGFTKQPGTERQSRRRGWFMWVLLRTWMAATLEAASEFAVTVLTDQSLLT